MHLHDLFLFMKIKLCSPRLAGSGFYSKVVSAVAWPCTHNSLQGASPQPLSLQPGPLSTHLTVQTSTGVISHTHSSGCNYCQGRQYRGKIKLSADNFVLKDLLVSPACIFILLPQFWEQQDSGQSGSVTMVISEQPVVTLMSSFIFCPIVSYYLQLLFSDSHISIK